MISTPTGQAVSASSHVAVNVDTRRLCYTEMHRSWTDRVLYCAHTLSVWLPRELAIRIACHTAALLFEDYIDLCLRSGRWRLVEAKDRRRFLCGTERLDLTDTERGELRERRERADWMEFRHRGAPLLLYRSFCTGSYRERNLDAYRSQLLPLKIHGGQLDLVQPSPCQLRALWSDQWHSDRDMLRDRFFFGVFSLCCLLLVGLLLLLPWSLLKPLLITPLYACT
jgi:hypothetical protein